VGLSHLGFKLNKPQVYDFAVHILPVNTQYAPPPIDTTYRDERKPT